VRLGMCPGSCLYPLRLIACFLRFSRSCVARGLMPATSRSTSLSLSTPLRGDQLDQLPAGAELIENLPELFPLGAYRQQLVGIRAEMPHRLAQLVRDVDRVS
jgi:hypothetical protein